MFAFSILTKKQSSMNIRKTKYGIRTYGIASALLLITYYLLDLKVLEPWGMYIPFMKKLTMSLFLIAFIFFISKIVTRLVNNQTHIQGERYNLLRIIRFLAIVFSLIVVASFIAWVYLVFRRSYLVGDRIQIKGFRGDVVSISYLDTSILECRGDYLGNDRSSGRVIRFPNSLVLREEIINYSGPKAPFIMNEIPIQVAYTSDLQFVEECLLSASIRDFNECYPQLTAQMNEQWEPTVYFRINRFAWMEAVVTYPVEPKDTSERRNRILRYALPLLNESPDKVKFPEGTQR